MSVFDLLDLGAGVISAGMASKAAKKLKAEHPEAYQCHLVLGKVCIQSSLNFSAVGSPDGPVMYRSDTLIRGLSMTNFKCYAFVVPEGLQIEIWYAPEDAQFVYDNETARELMNWVNSRLWLGRLFVHREFTNNVGKQVIELAYGVTVKCARVPHDQLEKALSNTIDDILAFREAFLPIIQATSRQKILFDALGEPAGPDAGQLLEKHNQALAKRNSIIVPGQREALEHRLAAILGGSGYPYEQHAGAQYFTVKPLTGADADYALHVLVNPYSQVVIQSYTPTLPVQQCSAIRHTDFLLNSNRTAAGSFHASLKDQRMIYRTGVDARGIEAALHGEWVDQMVQDHLRAKAVNMKAFQFILDENTPAEDVIGNLFSNAPAPAAVMPQRQVSAGTAGGALNPTVRGAPAPATVQVAPAQNPVVYSAPQPLGGQKNRNTALILEILPGLIGILGIGWLYSGNTLTGLLVLVGMLFFDVLALGGLLLSAGVGFLCVAPVYLLLIGLSAYLLNNYAKGHPEVFSS